LKSVKLKGIFLVNNNYADIDHFSKTITNTDTKDFIKFNKELVHTKDKKIADYCAKTKITNKSINLNFAIKKNTNHKSHEDLSNTKDKDLKIRTSISPLNK
jgi:hypothetical protein